MRPDPMLADHTVREVAEVEPEPDPLLLAEEAAIETPPRRRREVLLWLSVGWIVLLLLAAVFAAFLPIPGYEEPVGSPRLQPFQQWGDGLVLGTDTFGRSNLSRVVYGARASMMVGIVATGIGLVVGGFVGLISGYRRGWADRGSSFVVDTLLAFPPLVLLLALTAVLTPKLSTLLVGLSILVIPTFVRLERAAAMSWSARPFVLAARSYGSKDLRVAVRHVLPNSMLTLITYVPTVVSAMIVAEGSLSFLGLGLPSPTPSWGGMIAEGKSSLRVDPSVVFVPAAFVFLTVLAFNVLGERVRARYDSRER
jgi:peptide/nickel transport system permease protein